MSDSIIKIKDLYKQYKSPIGGASLIALNKVNLEIPRGSFFGLLGPNGAGKSTLINILAGITNKTSGKCIVNNYDLDDQPINAKLALGIVPQEVVFDPFFTIRQTLENYAGYFGVPKNERRTDEIIAALSLTAKADMPSRSLSGGMKRRMLIAKALVHNPKILILDEPTAGVDIELREQLWQYVQKLNKQGTTIVLTTHYIEEAEKLCSHIAVINGGAIIANDSKSKILHSLKDKTLAIKFNCDVEHLVDRDYLRKLGVQIDKNSLVIRYSQAKYLDEFIRYVVGKNLAITDIASAEVKLEDVLKHLIHKNSKYD